MPRLLFASTAPAFATLRGHTLFFDVVKWGELVSWRTGAPERLQLALVGSFQEQNRAHGKSGWSEPVGLCRSVLQQDNEGGRQLSASSSQRKPANPISKLVDLEGLKSATALRHLAFQNVDSSDSCPICSLPESWVELMSFSSV
ncbi:unnamed protein product [Durusdinium trenchii]|uniref:Uncharacterized protein n=1 Tax=Durusdinium trenchii TaxID=1381693 RepID=A0ABP0T1A1_9DINO